jgi:hypothetical protein
MYSIRQAISITKEALFFTDNELREDSFDLDIQSLVMDIVIFMYHWFRIRY